MLRRLIGEDIELEILTRSLVKNIEADPTQIEQILMNLAVNARDAMPNGGSLKIETDSVELRKYLRERGEEIRPGRYVLLKFTDTGEGIPPEIIDRIFEPFFTTKETGKGTGLGLATVYGIVKQHEGHIDVSSRPGAGTTFTIYFPESGEEGQAEETRERKSLPRGQETILVVDDEHAVRRLTVDTLEPLGYTVIGAASGREALDLVESYENRIDMLLTDIVMPGMNGIELADHLQQRRSDLRIVFMSGYSEHNESIQKAISSRSFYLNKPLIPSMLAVQVREILDTANG